MNVLGSEASHDVLQELMRDRSPGEVLPLVPVLQAFNLYLPSKLEWVTEVKAATTFNPDAIGFPVKERGWEPPGLEEGDPADFTGVYARRIDFVSNSIIIPEDKRNDGHIMTNVFEGPGSLPGPFAMSFVINGGNIIAIRRLTTHCTMGPDGTCLGLGCTCTPRRRPGSNSEWTCRCVEHQQP